VSGSGKSTLARDIIKASDDGVVLSTDDFFYNPVTSRYDYNVPALPKGIRHQTVAFHLILIHE